jgi:hypothetical protein
MQAPHQIAIELAICDCLTSKEFEKNEILAPTDL